MKNYLHLLGLLIIISLVNCTKEPIYNTEEKEEPEPDIPTEYFAIGTWEFTRMYGINDDGSHYDINTQISLYKKILQEGSLPQNELDRISYELPRLEAALNICPVQVYEIVEDNAGKLIYTTNEYGPYPLEWKKIDDNTFYFTYGGYFYYNFHADPSFLTGYYNMRDCDESGPNVNVHLQKRIFN